LYLDGDDSDSKDIDSAAINNHHFRAMARFKNIQFNMNSIPDLANLKRSKNSSLYLFNSDEIDSMIETSTFLRSMNEEDENRLLENDINLVDCNSGENQSVKSANSSNVYNLLQNFRKLKKEPELTLNKHSKLVTKANRYMMENKILRATRRYKRENPDKIGGQKRLKMLISKQLAEKSKRELLRVRLSHKFRKNKPKGLVDYLRTSGRDNFRRSLSMEDFDPDGKQFEKKETPKISSKNKHTRSIDFKKQSKRELCKKMYQNNKSYSELTNINPNFDYTKRKTVKIVPFIGKKSRVDYFSDRYKKIREAKFQKYFKRKKYNRNETLLISR
jgi:hypothetical protein